MDRRRFLSAFGLSLLGMAFADQLSPLMARKRRSEGEYSIVILGDTHFDTEPASVYHSHYDEPVEWLNRVQWAEFARNGEMWRERCPRMVKRATRLVGKDTRMVFQMGDLIQGDCGNGEVHRKMLDDVMNYFKGEFHGLPFITVEGNHDIRGIDAEDIYHRYMPERMSRELGKEITKTTFSFTIGPDAFIVIDFDHTDDEEIDRLLDDTVGARYTFVIVHGALFPMDDPDCRWIFHGGDSEKETAARRYFRRRFAERNVICLCGHTHTTEFYDWYGDGGRITQMTLNSVWANDGLGEYVVNAEGPEQYGELRKAGKKDDGSNAKNEDALFAEYRPGLKVWSHSYAAGSYRMNVSRKGVTIDFYAGDSEEVSHRFVLR